MGSATVAKRQKNRHQLKEDSSEEEFNEYNDSDNF
jgi:hypothetical protein